MKWIGQNIYDQVARFRNDVHITGDITMTGDVELTGGLTASGTIVADILTGVENDDLQIWSDGSMVFTIDRDNDETSQLFAFYNYLTEIASIDESGNLQVDGTITTGTTAAMTSAGLLSVANQSNITGVGTLASGNATAVVDAASDTAAGKVELATTAEADTGTDTARAVTPAGLKSHVDARFSYQYIALSMNSSTPADGDWMIASGNGIGNHLYNQDVGAGGTTPHNTDGSASQITISQNILSGGIIVPYDCTLVGFYAHSRASNNDQKALGLFTATATWNDKADITGFLRAYSEQDISAGPDTSYSVRPVEHSVLSINKALSAGDQMWPATRSVGGGAGGCITSMTIVLKTLIP